MSDTNERLAVVLLPVALLVAVWYLGGIRSPNLHEQQLSKTLSKLKEGKIAFVAPDTMNLSDSKPVEARIAQSLSADIRKGMEDLGVVQEAKIRVFGVMGARLTGANFEITPITPEVQIIPPSDGFTRWEWEVRPKDWGHQRLYLNVCVELDSRSGREQYCPSVYEREVAIHVSRRYAATHFIANNATWTLGTAGTLASMLISAIFLVRRKLRARGIGFAYR